MRRLIASPYKARRPRSPRNEQCGDCGGSGTDSSSRTCNGLGEIHCLVGRQEFRPLSRSVIRKECHRWPTR
ncbi:hypothetical protein B7C62_07990 [Kitasatospora albolonga]|uniref:Uncharacterized protein n=1 Tax=Kitasatospora albolonga TaxID=68173 RepID=A0ABC8BPW2_9ACTN|nr:hypothetical protein B7C62_07990 [Kitasatospora albolonga]